MPLTDEQMQAAVTAPTLEDEPDDDETDAGPAPAPGRPRLRRLVVRDPTLRALASFVQSLEKQTPPQRDATVRWLAAFYKVDL
jgi:hypothetical protein